MGEVTSLRGEPIPEREVNASAVLVLERMLEQARAGNVVGVVIAWRHFDGRASWSIGGLVHGYSLVGAVDVAKVELIQIMRGEE